MQKWGCFIDLFWRNSWFENPAILLAESSWVYTSETKFFPNMGFAQEPRNINFYYRTNSVKIYDEIFL